MVTVEKREEGFFSSLGPDFSPPSYMVSRSGMTSLECKPRPFPHGQILLRTTIFTHQDPSIISALALYQCKYRQKFRTLLWE